MSACGFIGTGLRRRVGRHRQVAPRGGQLQTGQQLANTCDGDGDDDGGLERRVQRALRDVDSVAQSWRFWGSWASQREN